jgi:hypothetical protein
MNPSQVLQTVGNVGVGLAALIYILPLQLLLFEVRRKRDEGGSGVFAGLLLILPMWLLLLVGLGCVSASGGFDGWGWPRYGVHAFMVCASLSMAVMSFACFEFPRHRDLLVRLSGAVPVYTFPVATLVLVVLSLNPGLAPGIPVAPVRWIWFACAAFSLAIVGGYLVWRVLWMRLRGGFAAVASRFRRSGPTEGEILSRIATLDSRDDFRELLRRAASFQGRTVRDAATRRLRESPEFLETLAATLSSLDPGDALEFLLGATLSPAEQTRLALPSRSAMERFISDIPAPNFMSPDRRKTLLLWGRKTLPAIAQKFSSTGVDFSGIPAALEHALRPDDTRRG